jgi:hypothetical protein
MIDTTLSTLVGAFGWSLAEHLIHENLGHKLAKNRNAFAREHVRHHATTSYFAPSTKKALAAVVAASAMAPLASFVAGPRKGLAFTGGFVGAYLGYEVLHRIAHTRAPRTRYGRWLRKHHFYHHFHEPAVNHGVPSPLFDHLFGTFRPVTQVRVPVRHAMPWLVDPASGEVWPQFAGDYALVRKREKPAAGEASHPAAA